MRQLPRGKRELPSHEDGGEREKREREMSFELPLPPSSISLSLTTDDPLSTSTEDESTSAARQAFVGRMMERFNSADVNGDGKVTFTGNERGRNTAKIGTSH